jgi:nucleoside-diphosphate-sugar epimerase
MRETAPDALVEYRRSNVAATEALALAASEAKVRRLVFVSSIKVNGERTCGTPFTEDTVPRPEDAYGVTKREAEEALSRIAKQTGLEAVVLRAPLLYGPRVKGNFLRLIQAIDRGMPLPFALVRNRRSLLYVENFVDATILCLSRPAAVAQTYLVADDEGISTPDLIRAVANALDRPARLIPFPPALLKLGGKILGRGEALARLLESLQVNSGKIRGELGWRPRFDMAAGLKHTARWYYQHFDNGLTG